MNFSASGHLRLFKVLQSKAFTLLWLGQTTSALGDSAFGIALAWLVLLLTGSATAMGLVMVAQTIPQLIFLLVGGVAADRFSRQKIMLYSDSLRAGIVLINTILLYIHLLYLWELVLLNLVFGCVRGFFDPAFQSIMPQIVPKEQLTSANSLISLSRQISWLIGPLFSFWLIAVGGVAIAFLFNGLSFLFSAGCLLFVNLPTGMQPSPTEQSVQVAGFSSRRFKAVIKDIGEGLQYVTITRWLWLMIVTSSLGGACFAAGVAIALPKLVHDVLQTGVWLLSTLATMNALGLILGNMTMARFPRLPRRGAISYSILIFSGLAFTVFGLSLPATLVPFILSAATVVVAFGLGAFGLIWTILIQEAIPLEKLGRVTSIDLLGTYCVIPVGYMIAGVLVDHIGPSPVFVLFGLINVLLAILALSSSSLRRLS